MKLIESEVLGLIDDKDGVAEGTATDELRGDWDDVAWKVLIDWPILIHVFGVFLWFTVRGRRIGLNVRHKVIVVIKERSKVWAILIFFGAF